MDDMIANKRHYFPEGANSDERICKGLRKLTRKYAVEVNKRTNQKVSAAEQARLVDAALRQVPQCHAVTGMNIFEPVTPLPAFMVLQSGDLTGYTGESEAIASNMANAIDWSDGSEATVRWISDAAINEAYWLSQPDFELVVAAANIAVSSAVQWEAVNEAGSWPNGNVPDQMSIFAARRLPRIVGADILGCAIASARSAWAFVIGGGGGVLAAIGYCAIGAVGASAAAAM